MESLTAGSPLEVSAKLEAHGGADLFCHRVILARAKAREERRTENIDFHRFIDGRHNRPAALPRIGDPPGEI